MCSHGLYIKCISIRTAPSKRITETASSRKGSEKEAGTFLDAARCANTFFVNDLRQIVRHELLVEIEAYLRP